MPQFFPRPGEVTFRPADRNFCLHRGQSSELDPAQSRQPSARSWGRWFLLGLAVTCTFVAHPGVVAAALTADEIRLGTNIARAEDHLVTLNDSQSLDAAAAAKAKNMIAENYFNHDAPSGWSPWYWFQQVGYAYTAAGENLAIDFVDSADVIQAWMESPDHRQNILNAKYHDLGVAVLPGTVDGRETTIVVQLFGSRTVPAAPVVVIPTPAPKKATPAPMAKPVVPDAVAVVQAAATPKVPSLVLPDGVDQPVLTFSLVEPARWTEAPALQTRLVPDPQVAGIEVGGPDQGPRAALPARFSNDLPTITLMAMAAELIFLAILLGLKKYPGFALKLQVI
ncbi:MAG: hypothetical protein HY092_03690 [Candidatus Kerfeldbacteria bacterium]|nr:hypothetical protein [Candidatus Kerfeldbacteria bacterium]